MQPTLRGAMSPWRALAVFALGLAPLPLFAQQSGDEDFGKYFLEHQGDLAPFFAKNGTVLLAGAMPLLMAWIAAILFLPFLVGWGIDVLLARGFAHLFTRNCAGSVLPLPTPPAAWPSAWCW